MKTPFSKEGERALRFAEEEAARCGSMQVLPGHLFLALLRDPECSASKAAALAGARTEAIKSALEDGLMRERAVKYGRKDEINFSDGAELSLAMADLFSQAKNIREIGSVEILIGLLRSGDRLVCATAESHGISERSIIEAGSTAAGVEAMLRSAIQTELRQRQGQGHPQAGQESEGTSLMKPLS